ncbi:DUF4397 domain-containing protein [Chitinophaga vietnamensis]|uniref:DUF4397 domain-containing protein n=1 Tax=Chitinophaga vietnamensis TaxID=2593957 RepID=UPI0011774F47|nr:DUF4397 domain-containing protein [Chitinophaga vietnamensis]
MNQLNNKYVKITALVLGLLSQSCTKTGHSIDAPASTSINVFNASHVYDSMAAGTTRPRLVWMSGFDTAGTLLRTQFSAYGNYEIPDDGPQEAIRRDRSMRYYDFIAGSQRVRFADTAGIIVADTMLDFSSGSYNSIYLADDTTHVNASTRSGLFRVFSFPEEKTSTAGKVRLRYIDLVLDKDTLNGYIFASNGRKFSSNATPHALTYGTASSYYDLDTAGLVINGEMRLRIFPKADTTSVITQVPIPATPGRTYTVLLFGHVNTWNCRFAVKQPDGSVMQRLVSFPGNVRGCVRTVN